MMGFVSWIQLTPTWLNADESRRAHARRQIRADALVEPRRRCARRAGAGGRRSMCNRCDRVRGNPFDRDAAAAMKIETVLATASRLFNRRGIDGVSLDDVTAELGATKGALYHYFEDKADLVRRCYERAFDFYEADRRCRRQARRQPGSNKAPSAFI